MYGPLALILAAVGVFLGVVVRRGFSDDDDPVAVDQARGFALVGTGAMIMFAALVVIVGLLAPPDGMAESLGVLAGFGFLLYLTLAGAVIMIAGALRERGSAAAQQARHRDPGGDRAGQSADHAGPDQA